MRQSDRYRRGWDKLKEIDGEAGEQVVQGLKDIAPDLAKYIIEYSFGDIYAREGLDLKRKEIAAVAALTAMGTAQPQLKVHLHGALNTGNTINEVKVSRLDALQPDRLRAAFGDFSPEVVRFTLEYGYADIFARDNLGKQERQIATIAALTALGNAQAQLRFHIQAGLNVGLTIEAIREVMLLMTVYAGFPAAINGTNILKDVVGGGH